MTETTAAQEQIVRDEIAKIKGISSLVSSVVSSALFVLGTFGLASLMFRPHFAMDTSDPNLSALNALKDISVALASIAAFVGAAVAHYIARD